MKRGRTGNWWDRNITSKKKITPPLVIGGFVCAVCGVRCENDDRNPSYGQIHDRSLDVVFLRLTPPPPISP